MGTWTSTASGTAAPLTLGIIADAQGNLSGVAGALDANGNVALIPVTQATLDAAGNLALTCGNATGAYGQVQLTGVVAQAAITGSYTIQGTATDSGTFSLAPGAALAAGTAPNATSGPLGATATGAASGGAWLGAATSSASGTSSSAGLFLLADANGSLAGYLAEITSNYVLFLPVLSGSSVTATGAFTISCGSTTATESLTGTIGASSLQGNYTVQGGNDSGTVAMTPGPALGAAATAASGITSNGGVWVGASTSTAAGTNSIVFGIVADSQGNLSGVVGEYDLNGDLALLPVTQVSVDASGNLALTCGNTAGAYGQIVFTGTVTASGINGNYVTSGPSPDSGSFSLTPGAPLASGTNVDVTGALGPNATGAAWGGAWLGTETSSASGSDVEAGLFLLADTQGYLAGYLEVMDSLGNVNLLPVLSGSTIDASGAFTISCGSTLGAETLTGTIAGAALQGSYTMTGDNGSVSMTPSPAFDASLASGGSSSGGSTSSSGATRSKSIHETKATTVIKEGGVTRTIVRNDKTTETTVVNGDTTKTSFKIDDSTKTTTKKGDESKTVASTTTGSGVETVVATGDTTRTTETESLTTKTGDTVETAKKKDESTKTTETVGAATVTKEKFDDKTKTTVKTGHESKTTTATRQGSETTTTSGDTTRKSETEKTSTRSGGSTKTTDTNLHETTTRSGDTTKTTETETVKTTTKSDGKTKTAEKTVATTETTTKKGDTTETKKTTTTTSGDTVHTTTTVAKASADTKKSGETTQTTSETHETKAETESKKKEKK
jgi:hypothetical protein